MNNLYILNNTPDTNKSKKDKCPWDHFRVADQGPVSCDPHICMENGEDPVTADAISSVPSKAHVQTCHDHLI